jgi:hypothetical protein
MWTIRMGLAVGLCLTAGPGAVSGNQPLTLEVSPAVSPAPGYVIIRALIEAHDDNRALEIVAQSSEFTRSSVIDLDGRRAPRLSVFEYPNLPPGLYEVTGLIVGTHGKRAATNRIFRIVPSAGSPRW